MDYTKMDRQEQNRILRQHGYRWEKNYEYDFDHYEEPDGTFVWELYSSDGREVTVARAFAEIERGVIARERSDPAQGEVLRRWFEGRVLPTFAGRVLPFDLNAARVLAGYRVPEHAPLDDALIAAVAEVAGMIVVTRNTRHFEPLGVARVNPWEDASPG